MIPPAPIHVSEKEEPRQGLWAECTVLLGAAFVLELEGVISGMEPFSQSEIQPTAQEGQGEEGLVLSLAPSFAFLLHLLAPVPCLSLVRAEWTQFMLHKGDTKVPRQWRGSWGSAPGLPGTLLSVGLCFSRAGLSPHRCPFTSLESPTTRTLSPLVMLCQA